jgi:alkylhydroperoxidase family enzyme
MKVFVVMYYTMHIGFVHGIFESRERAELRAAELATTLGPTEALFKEYVVEEWGLE